MPVTPIQPLCACPPDSTYTLLKKLLNNLSFVLRQIDPSFTGSVANMSSCPCTELGILQAINRVLIDFAASYAGASQKGRTAIVAGQQNYDIVFDTPFDVAPEFFEAGVLMVSSSGETFIVAADLSTLTAAGVTVWLSGIPSSASNGSYITWVAIP